MLVTSIRIAIDCSTNIFPLTVLMLHIVKHSPVDVQIVYIITEGKCIEYTPEYRSSCLVKVSL